MVPFARSCWVSGVVSKKYVLIIMQDRKSAVIAPRWVGELDDLFFPLIVHKEKHLNGRQNEEYAEKNDGPSLFVELVMIGAEED